MKISQFNPRNESTRFCSIPHPVQGEDLVDSDGVAIGFDVVSSNSKKANQLRREMREGILQDKDTLAKELGRPDVGEAPTAEEKELLKAWEDEHLETFTTRATEMVRLRMIYFLSECCVKMHGHIELDNGQKAETPLQLFETEEWVADRVYAFHNDLGNWVPKL